jgi:glyoxylase-like metal-dependent hydrolase (beta-lactamase superfamily II)
MKQIRPDLWETRSFSPFPGLHTHAYLWTSSQGENVLFYSPGDDADHDAIAELGGVARQYLSHRDEAGPMLAAIAERFGARLHAPAAEADDIGRFAPVHVPLATRHVDDLGIEIIPSPGHTPGSTSYLVPGAGGLRYLFVGDTMFTTDGGHWAAGYIPPVSDAERLAATLRDVLRPLHPDVVISSAYQGEAVHELDGAPWSACVDAALERLAPDLGAIRR